METSLTSWLGFRNEGSLATAALSRLSGHDRASFPKPRLVEVQVSGGFSRATGVLPTVVV